MRKNARKISVVIPTYNRCPHTGEDITLNPIWWSSNSLFREKVVSEIILVDDCSCSEDHFSETVEKISKSSPNHIEIKHIQNRERKGSGESRNAGVEMANNDLIFFYDDDCILAKKGIVDTLQMAFDSLKKKGLNIVAMTLPVSGNSIGSILYPSKFIGKIDRDTGLLHGIYTKFPMEYVEDLDNCYLDKDLKIFNPLEVEVMGGVFLCDKKAYQNVDGFPKTKWKNACAEEPELMFNMQRNDGEIFYLPSLEYGFRVLHLRYGDPEFDRRIDYPIQVDGVLIKDIIRESAKPRVGHGNRVGKENELYSSIMSNSRLLFKYRDLFGKDVGLKHLRTRQMETIEYNGKYDTFQMAVKDGTELMTEEGIISFDEGSKLKLEFLKDYVERKKF